METTQSGFDHLLNDEQYMHDYNEWTRDIAEELARQNYIVEEKLTPEHWKVIEYVRSFYKEYCRGPSVVQIGKATGYNSKKICELFPCGTVRGAYRLAGLPRPPGCI